MSGKWREWMLPRKRVEEYARMVLGPYRYDNNTLSTVTQTLYRMLNEQRDLDRQERFRRAEERRTGERRPKPVSEVSKALAGYGPDWKQRLAQRFFGRDRRAD